MKVWPGRPYPLGATWDGEGGNVSLFSENATSVELCLFDGPDASQESHRIRVEERTNQTWHAYLPEDAWPPLRFRVNGPMTRPRDTGSIRQSCCLTLCQIHRRYHSVIRIACSATSLVMPRAISCAMIATMRKICRGVSWWIKAFSWGRSPAPHAVVKTVIYRSARQGIHGQASACAGTFAWHVCRVIDAGGH